VRIGDVDPLPRATGPQRVERRRIPHGRHQRVAVAGEREHLLFPRRRQQRVALVGADPENCRRIPERRNHVLRTRRAKRVDEFGGRRVEAPRAAVRLDQEDPALGPAVGRHVDGEGGPRAPAAAALRTAAAGVGPVRSHGDGTVREDGDGAKLIGIGVVEDARGAVAADPNQESLAGGAGEQGAVRVVRERHHVRILRFGEQRSPPRGGDPKDFPLVPGPRVERAVLPP
jgi:hypothetical protein